MGVLFQSVYKGCNYDLNELFGVAIPAIVDIINVLHGSIMVA